MTDKRGVIARIIDPDPRVWMGDGEYKLERERIARRRKGAYAKADTILAHLSPDRGQAMSTPATKIVEDCFAEDILKQSTRLKVFPDEGESPGTWQQRVRKAAILAALADQPAMSTHDETCWLIEKCAKIADKRRVEERAKGNLSKGHVAEEIASDIRALATPFTPDDVGRATRSSLAFDRDFIAREIANAAGCQVGSQRTERLTSYVISKIEAALVLSRTPSTPGVREALEKLSAALNKVSPITTRDTPDYAELYFGEHQTQAMTMAPRDWNEVAAAHDEARAALSAKEQGR